MHRALVHFVVIRCNALHPTLLLTAKFGACFEVAVKPAVGFDYSPAIFGSTAGHFHIFPRVRTAGSCAIWQDARADFSFRLCTRAALRFIIIFSFAGILCLFVGCCPARKTLFFAPIVATPSVLIVVGFCIHFASLSPLAIIGSALLFNFVFFPGFIGIITQICRDQKEKEGERFFKKGEIIRRLAGPIGASKGQSPSHCALSQTPPFFQKSKAPPKAHPKQKKTKGKGKKRRKKRRRRTKR